MKRKSLVSLLLCAILMATSIIPSLGAPIAPPPLSQPVPALNISYCEFVRTVVIAVSGTQPLIMDTHYATSYMNQAEKLKLITPTVMADWDKPLSPLQKDAILAKVTPEQRTAINKTMDALLVNAITVNGKPLDLGELSIFVRNGHVMIPLRKTAEALGFTVLWSPQANIDLDNGVVKTHLEIGFDSYYKASSTAIGLTQAKPMGTPPTLRNGSTYVPAQLFSLLYSNENSVSVSGGVMALQNK